MGGVGQIDELAVRCQKMLGRQTRKASDHFTKVIRLQGFPSKMRDSGGSLSTRNTFAMEREKPPAVGGTLSGIYSLLPSGKSGPKLLPRLAASLSPTKGRMDEEGAIEYPNSPDKQRDEIAESAIAGTPKKTLGCSELPKTCGRRFEHERSGAKGVQPAEGRTLRCRHAEFCAIVGRRGLPVT